MEFKQLSQSNIEQVKNEQKWLIEKLNVALEKEQRSKIPELYNEYHTTEKFIDCLRREFYRQPAFIPADFTENKRREIKDNMWQDWRNHRFQTWQQMVDEALKDCNPKEIIKKRKFVEQCLKASEHKADESAIKSESVLSGQNLSVTSQAISKKRAKAAKQNRIVKDNGDRAKIKAAVLRKIKKGYTHNQAHEGIANLCKSKENLLKLKEGPYQFISARTVRRIAVGS